MNLDSYNDRGFRSMRLWYQLPGLNERLGCLGLWESFLFSFSCLAPLLLVNMLYPLPASPSAKLESSFLLQSTFYDSLLCSYSRLYHKSLWQLWADISASAPCQVHLPAQANSLSILNGPSLQPPWNLIQLVQHQGNERVYVCLYVLGKLIFCWIAHWAET